MAKEKVELDKLIYEKEEQAKGNFLIAGVDEVGRGPLAGPVCVAAVIMPLDDLIEGVDDSKKLSEKKRDLLFEKIKEKAIASSTVVATIILFVNCSALAFIAITSG